MLKIERAAGFLEGYNTLDLSKFLIQNMPIKKQQRIEHLVLC
jgi:hypothetical protein